jgi:hypothetical protein
VLLGFLPSDTWKQNWFGTPFKPIMAFWVLAWPSNHSDHHHMMNRLSNRDGQKLNHQKCTWLGVEISWIHDNIWITEINVQNGTVRWHVSFQFDLEHSTLVRTCI